MTSETFFSENLISLENSGEGNFIYEAQKPTKNSFKTRLFKKEGNIHRNNWNL